MKSYMLTLDVSEAEADDVAALLLAEGALGAEVRDGSVLPMPDTERPGPGRAHVLAFFSLAEEARSAAESLGRQGILEEIADEDWSERWKRDLVPFAIGRVFIRPSWTDDPRPPGTIEVILDPGMAFGTGTHPTTSMCLGALDELLAVSPGTEVLDVGTGSGLLAIAARKLGAKRVVGTENDPVALEVAAENGARNGVELELRLEPPDRIEGVFGVVVANILANTLVTLAPGIASRVAPGGTLLLSGLLEGQEEEVRAAYVGAGLTPYPGRDRSDGPWRLVAMRRSGRST